MNAPGAIHLCSGRTHADLALLACARAMTPRDLCIVIDDARGAARARVLGLHVDAHVAPPMRTPWLASRALRTLLRETECDQRTLIAWGAHLEPLITATKGEQILVDFARGVIERFPGSLRGPGPIRTLAAPNAPLGVALSSEARAAWREQFGLEPSEHAVALVGVTPGECDVPAFVHVLGMLHFAKVPVVGVVDRALMSRHRAAIRRAREAMPNLRVLVRDEPMLAWVGACDAAVLAPGDRFDSGDSQRRFDAPLLARTIAAAGVPIIAAQNDAGDAVDSGDADNAHDDLIVRTESAHPATMARALRLRLDSGKPANNPAANHALNAGHAPHAPHTPHTWRRALDAITDPASVSALAAADGAVA